MTAGWYGKLPALGDFAQRRLEQDFVHAWDGWLQAVVHDSQRALGAGWLNTYLCAPVWRFLLQPGSLASLGANPWAGVLLPSVDRVGRYFPLTVCAPLPALPCAATQLAALDGWLDGLERAARNCLSHDATVQGFEEELARVGPPPASQGSPGTPGLGGGAGRALLARSASVGLPRTPGAPPALDSLADALLTEALAGYSLWWDSDGRSASAHQGLPPGSAYLRMLQTTAAG